MKPSMNIAVPSNNFFDFEKYFLKGIANLSELVAYAQIFVSVNTQGDSWTKDRIKATKKILKANGIKPRFIVSKERKFARMNKLRKDAMACVPSADYFMIADDNLEFRISGSNKLITSGLKYRHCIEYMEKYSDCGLIQCEGSLGGYLQRDNIKSTRATRFWTCRGLIVRNIGLDELIPPETEHFTGALEERLISFMLIERGFYPAKQFNNPTMHRDIHRVESGIYSHLHDHDRTMGGNNKFIAKRYNDPNWVGMPQNSPYPKGLMEMYLNSGGDWNLCTEPFNEMIFEIGD